jgi:hypothetical protein
LKKKKRISPGFDRVVAPAGLLVNPDRFSHRIDQPGRGGFNITAKNVNLGNITDEKGS